MTTAATVEWDCSCCRYNIEMLLPVLSCSVFQLADDVDGASLGFVEDAADVFAQDADGDKLDGTKEEHHGHDGGETSDRLAPYDGFNNDP